MNIVRRPTLNGRLSSLALVIMAVLGASVLAFGQWVYHPTADD